MIRPNLECHSNRRRTLVAADPGMGGLDYLEVLQPPALDAVRKHVLAALGRQHFRLEAHCVLAVNLLGKSPVDGLGPENVRIVGGRRIRNVEVLDAGLCPQRRAESKLDDLLFVVVDRAGDASSYSLEIVERSDLRHAAGRPHPKFDPRLSRLPFSFRQACATDLDCKHDGVRPGPKVEQPEINYLAKDYDSFRQLILDRFGTLMPDWRERSSADFGIAMVELLAYVGDRLSYYQDAVATEAYLGTARRRISVRRHARLVDYVLHEGCNARAWVCVDTKQDLKAIDPRDIFFFTDPGFGGNSARPQQNGTPAAAKKDCQPPLQAEQPVVRQRDLQPFGSELYEVFEPVAMEADTVWFTAADVKHPAALAMQLKSGSHSAAVLNALRSELAKSEFAQRLLDQYQGDEETHGHPSVLLQAELVQALNRLLKSTEIAGPVTSQISGLRAATFDAALLWRNRRIIEAAFTPQGASRPEILMRRRSPDHLQAFGIENEPVSFHAAQSCIPIHTWGEQQCALHRGATSATLQDEYVDRQTSQQQTQVPAGRQWYERQRALADLQPGDVLIFEEVKGLRTGLPADADPARRHALRLTRVVFDVDPLDKIDDGQQGENFGRPIVHVEWSDEDALPFPVTISAVGPAPGCRLINNITVARGNVLLVDHGRTLASHESLGRVALQDSQPECEGIGRPSEITLNAGPYHPALSQRPLTFGRSLAADTPAAAALRQDVRRAAPQLQLHSIPPAPGGKDPLFEFEHVQDWDSRPTSVQVAKRIELVKQLRKDQPEFRYRAIRYRLSAAARQWLDDDASDADNDKHDKNEIAARLARYLATDALETWRPRPDLLDSDGDDRHFVAELDETGTAQLRFGDGQLGKDPEPGESFLTRYRVGNGARGNVGAQSITRLAVRDNAGSGSAAIVGASVITRNPLAAAGGTDAESMEEAKLLAPSAFRTEPKRAVTADDYARLVEKQFSRQVQRAAAVRRWTGCTEEIRVTVDPRGAAEPSPALLSAIEETLQLYRRIGHDIRVAPPAYVPLEIALCVTVQPGWFPAHVKLAVAQALGNQTMPDGRAGFFHPDRISFGAGIRMSELVVAVHEVPGVRRVQVITFKRLHLPPSGELAEGIIRLHPLEIARLDNDPSFPENGVLRMRMEEGP